MSLLFVIDPSDLAALTCEQRDRSTIIHKDGQVVCPSELDGEEIPPTFTNLLTFSPALALEEHDQCKPHTDWSRKTRQNLALMKAAANPTQSKITSFFQIVDKMEKLVEQNPEMKELMRGCTMSKKRKRGRKYMPIIKTTPCECREECPNAPSAKKA